MSTLEPVGIASTATLGSPALGPDPALNVLAASSVVARVHVPGLDRQLGPPALDPDSGLPALAVREGRTVATPFIDPPGAVISVRLGGGLPDALLDTTWQRMLSDPGSGSATVGADDDAAATTYGDVLQFSLGGKVRQSCIVETIERSLISSGEEAGERVTFSGRGLIAEWEDVIVYPDLGLTGPPKQEERRFDWTNCDSSHWGSSVSTEARYGQRGAQLFATPEGWPTNRAKWMWDRSTAFGAAPPGDVYFRENFGLLGADAGKYHFWIAADDEYECFIDGVPLSSREGAYNGQADHAELDLDGGPGVEAVFHYISVRATNRIGRGGVLCALLKLNAFGGYDVAPVRASTTGWRCLGYPASPPAQTIGKVITHLWLEAHVRGSLQGWQLGFSETHDSGGRPWPLATDLTVPIGISMLDFLNQLAGSYIDYSFMPATRTLLAYNIDTMGVSTPPPSPLTELTSTGSA